MYGNTARRSPTVLASSCPPKSLSDRELPICSVKCTLHGPKFLHFPSCIPNRGQICPVSPDVVTHNSPRLRDGFGDMAFVFKYRVAAGTEHQANYVVTAFLTTTVPTGTYSNGATHATFSPTLALGKGWGNFDIQSTAGVTLPTGAIDVLGTPIALNATAQYRILGRLWPEIEVNSAFWKNGRNAGKKQVFLSPGVVVGRLRLWKRLGFAIGTGVQIAATPFHTYNHNWVLSVRFPF